jgi:AMP phosphorylase
MKLIARMYDVDSSEPRVVAHRDDCKEMGVKQMDRVRLNASSSQVIVVSISDSIVKKGEILVPRSIMSKIGAKDKQAIEAIYSPKPDSVKGIRKKMDSAKLTRDEIHEIVFDILENRLSKIEISAWLTALYINGMDNEEIANFTHSMVNTGEKILFDRTPVFDFHSLGGVPGNKITPIVVSIVAAAGLMIPKTSSRAISSACGTSDFVEVFCNVELEASRLKKISETIGGVFAWGGSMNIAPVDDMVIDIEYSLGINPRAQMLASIMSKKLAISATHLLVDIPMGAGTKVKSLEEAREYARDLMELGSKLGIRTECAITYGDQPVGSAIGPALEAKECIRILEGHAHPASVVEKACDLAGMILEMGGIPDGPTKAREILSSGAAFKKFREIVEAQGGKKDITSEDIPMGRFMHDVKAVRSGYVHAINNKDLVAIARAAGAPADKGAGILLFRKKGQRAEKGETLFHIYADNQAKADRARDIAIKLEPMDIEGMLIKKVPNPSALKSI